mgnify:CR=1 FL=1
MARYFQCWMSIATVSTVGHLLGYARVSTTDQDAALQVDALTAAGCYRVFVDTISIMYGQKDARGIVHMRAFSLLLYTVGILAAIVVLVDQWTKHLVRGALRNPATRAEAMSLILG